MRTQAQKEADKRYKQKVIQKNIQYYSHELQEYKQIEEHCNLLNISFQQYTKNLIKEDMKRWT